MNFSTNKIRLFFSLTLLVVTNANAESIIESYQPLTPSVAHNKLTTKGEIVMVELYKEIGMEFKIKGKEQPTPPVIDPEPTPPKPKPKKSDDFFDDDFTFDDTLEDFDKEYEETVSEWDKEYKETIARWGLAQKQYEKKKEKYKALTYDLGKFVDNQTSVSAPLAATTGYSRPSKPGDFHIIPYAFTQSTQDQKSRGTCAAFAGIRTIENLIAQHEVNKYADQVDLSEQQFFYLSRIKCMQPPCRPQYDTKGYVKNDGSNYDVGFTVNKKISEPDAALMEEKYCLYRPRIQDNVSFSPLHQYCNTNSGATRYRVSAMTKDIPFSALLSELDANRPIAVAFKLPNSFMNSKGFVSLINPNTGQGTGPHTGGHAMSLVGYIMLPEKHWAREGKYCAILANSWGEGWGKGGYACATEKWMRKFYKYATSISQVNKVQVNLSRR